MSKKKRAKKLTRKQRSRLEREQNIKRILIWGVVLVGIAVVGVLAYGFVFENVIKARKPVAVVGDTPIKTSEFKARVKFTRMQMRNKLQYLYRQQQQMNAESSDTQSLSEYLQQQIQNIQAQLAPQNAASIGEQTLNQLIQEELVRQEAERRGISVTPQEVQKEVESSFGYNPDATPEPTSSLPLTSTGSLTGTQPTPPPTPTQMTEADFRKMYNRYRSNVLQPLGISEELYRSWLKASLLTEKLKESMKEDLPTEAEQVKLRLLSAKSEERANELVARLDAGDDFQTISEELKEDDTAYATELGWAPRDLLESQLGEELAGKAFSMEIGEHDQPMAIQEGQRYVVVEVAGREVRPLEDSMRKRIAESAFQSWLEAQQVSVERKEYKDVVPTEP